MQLNEFDSKATKLFLVGYEENSPNYRLSSRSLRKIKVVRHVTFNKQSEKVNTGTTASMNDDELCIFNSPQKDQYNMDDCEEGNHPGASLTDVSLPTPTPPTALPRALRDKKLPLTKSLKLTNAMAHGLLHLESQATRPSITTGC